MDCVGTFRGNELQLWVLRLLEQFICTTGSTGGGGGCCVCVPGGLIYLFIVTTVDCTATTLTVLHPHPRVFIVYHVHILHTGIIFWSVQAGLTRLSHKHYRLLLWHVGSTETFPICLLPDTDISKVKATCLLLCWDMKICSIWFWGN